jgi:hypothetical protein
MDMNSVMALEGTVTEFAFRNPHVQPASSGMLPASNGGDLGRSGGERP